MVREGVHLRWTEGLTTKISILGQARNPDFYEKIPAPAWPAGGFAGITDKLLIRRNQTLLGIPFIFQRIQWYSVLLTIQEIPLNVFIQNSQVATTQ